MWGVVREGGNGGNDGEGVRALQDESLDLCEILLHEEAEQKDETVVKRIIT